MKVFHIASAIQSTEEYVWVSDFAAGGGRSCERNNKTDLSSRCQALALHDLQDVVCISSTAADAVVAATVVVLHKAV